MSTLSRFFFPLILISLVGSGCVLSPHKLATTSRAVVPLIQPITKDWQPVTADIDKLETNFSTTTDIRATIYRIQPDAFTWSFEHASSPHSIAVWADTLSDADVIVNGVYFHEDFLPSGWLIRHGQRIGDRAFDVDRSAILNLSPSIELLKTKTTLPSSQTIQEAAQSYPVLIEKGQLMVERDTGLVARRTFIGKDVDGLIYIGVVPDALVSLRGLADRLATLPISWSFVLNLDGGPSSGIAIKTSKTESEIIPNDNAVPNVIVGRRK